MWLIVAVVACMVFVGLMIKSTIDEDNRQLAEWERFLRETHEESERAKVRRQILKK